MRETKAGRFLDPRNGFAETLVESEVRTDPLTGDSGRICHFSFDLAPPVDLSQMIETSAESCPFCPEKVRAITPRYQDDFLPGGRLEWGEAVLFPNLFPYDDVSAIAVLSEAHFLPMENVPARIVADGLHVAREFFRHIEKDRVAARDSYGIVTWNYMPPSGGSQVHPHMQVIHTTSPGNGLRRHLEAAESWAQFHGRPYAEALVETERNNMDRWIGEQDGISWLVPFVPTGILGDCIAVFPDSCRISDLTDAEIDGFSTGLRAVLGAFAARGLWSFNLVFLPDHGSAERDRHRLTARLVPRLYINPAYHVTDVAYMQLILEERFAMTYPEANAAQLRAQLENKAD
ncbi:MAG: hypothetical protein GY791_17825 [Alphaproteobacteria bacterium]|nr:hypothetical protein [Alphaproteobacteria bacterium]